MFVYSALFFPTLVYRPSQWPSAFFESHPNRQQVVIKTDFAAVDYQGNGSRIRLTISLASGAYQLPASSLGWFKNRHKRLVRRGNFPRSGPVRTTLDRWSFYHSNRGWLRTRSYFSEGEGYVLAATIGQVVASFL
ncbi:hypothetical protein CMK12_14760 [Candidatus Poribacteria bacterium]|nr:hypothetical protein [Candidatus Poribacteria bacterium]